MDARLAVVEAICGNLIKRNVAVDQRMRDELLKIFDHYQIVLVQTEPTMNIQLWINRFLAAKKTDGLSPRTLLSYKQRLELFMRHIELDVDRIMTNDIRDYLSYLTETRHLKETTLATEINILRSFFTWLQTEEVISKNPMLRIRSPKINKKRLRRAFSVEEIEHIRNACESARDKALFEFFYSSGCRLSEIASINTQDINFFERSVVVTGKGDKERTIYFSTRAKIFLQEYLHNRKGNDNALFTSARMPYARLKTRAIQKSIKKMGLAAKIESCAYPHRLRHAFATHAFNSGMAMETIQVLLGHEDLNTTQIYATYSSNAVRNEYHRLIL